MSDDLIKRSDAIKALKDSVVEMGGEDFCEMGVHTDDIEAVVNAIPSADRPQGKVDAVEIYERAEHNLEQGYITIGEFDKRIEPLRHLCYGKPQGQWMCRMINPINAYFECSECGYKGDTKRYNFCPNCGCRMKGADDEHDK